MTVQELSESGFMDIAVRNSDPNAFAYDLLETKHRFFEMLTRRQIELISPSRPKRILDVGCSTGVSAMALYSSFSSDSPPRIFALDVSESTPSRAKERYRNIPGLYFVQGNAENLDSFFHEGFDGIFFNASVSRSPKSAAIRQACGLLVPDGVLSISYCDGLFNDNGDDAIFKVFPEMKHHFGSFSCHEIASCFESLPNFRTTWIDFRFEASREFLFDFLSIPEQSCALFPKYQYLDRIPMIRDFCSAMEGKAGPIFMGWKFCIARKSIRLAS